MKKIAIIGAGVVGSSMAILMQRKGYRITGVASRRQASAEALGERVGSLTTTTDIANIVDNAEIVLIATPDREISRVAESLADAPGFRFGTIVIHLSGALTSDILSPVKRRGGLVLSLHPLQSFANVEGALTGLPGSVFTLEGDDTAIVTGQELVRALGGQPVSIKAEDKVLYHGAACIAANYLVSLAHLAVSLFEAAGFTQEQAGQALIPLMRGVLDNVAVSGPVRSLTGPIARGDTGTVVKHLVTLKEKYPGALDIYCLLGQYTVKVALEKGTLNPEAAQELEGLLRS